MRISKAVLAIGVAAAAVIAGGSAGAATSFVDDTKATYLQKCAVCHAPDGSGNTAYGKKNGLKDIRSKDVQSLSDDKLMAIIAKGAGKMPGYEKSLGSDVCKKLVGYMRELAKK